MVVAVGCWIDVERGCEAAVAVQTEAFVVAFQLWTRWGGIGVGGGAADGLAKRAAGAGYYCLCGAGG